MDRRRSKSIANISAVSVTREENDDEHRVLPSLGKRAQLFIEKPGSLSNNMKRVYLSSTPQRHKEGIKKILHLKKRT